MSNILIFGDSIAHGYWDCQGGWVVRLRKYIDQIILSKDPNYWCEIYECGVSGDTTKELLNRFERELKVRIWDEKPIIVLAIGINDSIYFEHKKANKVAIDDFKNNLEKLYKIALKYSEQIIFLGLTPVDESKITPMSWSLTQFVYEENVEKYNQIIKKFCQKYKLQYTDLMTEFKKQNYKKLLHDGLHPNDRGHELIYKIVLENLKSLIS